MINKNSKITFFRYFPCECSAVEEYLEIMAEKGWLLKSVNGAFFKFTKIRPKKIKFSVDILNNISVLDSDDSDEALNYREYCEAAGWDYVCQANKIQIFYAEDGSEAIPIHTDEREKFKSVFKYSLFNIGYLIFMSLLFIFNINLSIKNIEYNLLSNLSLFAVIVMSSFILMSIVEIINFSIWVIRASVNLKDNRFIPYNRYKSIKIKNYFLYGYILVIFIIFFILINLDTNGNRVYNNLKFIIMFMPVIFIALIQRFFKKSDYSKKTNRAIIIGAVLVCTYITLVFVGFVVLLDLSENYKKDNTNHKVPLSILDFGYEEEDSELYVDYTKSILGEKNDYSYYDYKNGLGYSIFKSRYPWVIKYYGSEILAKLNKYEIDLKEIQTNLPSEVKVYSDQEKRNYVLVLEDSVIHINDKPNDIGEEEFLNRVYEKLLS